MSAGQVNMGTKTPKRPGPIPDILMIDYNSSAGICSMRVRYLKISYPNVSLQLYQLTRPIDTCSNHLTQSTTLPTDHMTDPTNWPKYMT